MNLEMYVSKLTALFRTCGYLHLIPLLMGFDELLNIPKETQSKALMNFEVCVKAVVDEDTYDEFEFIMEEIYDNFNIRYAN